MLRWIVALSLAAPLAAQPLPPKIIDYRLPLVEAKPAQPSKFIEAAGRRAAMLGSEDGTFEAWLFPIKLVRDVRLSVYIDNALEPTPLSSLAERVLVAPSRVTIVHSHAAFTIKQTWVASFDQPVAAVLLDIETSRPLKLRATFTPEMKPMWPASFGGQASWFDEKEKVFFFSEGLRRFTPVMGSPLFTRASEQIGHQLPDRTVIVEMDVTPDQAGKGLVPIVFANTLDLYRQWMSKADQIVDEADTEASDVRSTSFQLRSGEKRLDDAFRYAVQALEKGWVCNDGVGCGLVAGWAASGASERPGFGWYFGGDAFMNSWAVLDYGDFDRVRGILAFYRDKQRADGKMPHEWTQSAALLDWSKYPYGYYHADTTPLYIFSVARYVRRSGDTKFLDETWPSVEKAYQACLLYVDADGLLSNKKGGAGAVETGALSGRVEKDVYLQGTWLAALQGFAEMARWRKNPALEKDAQARLDRARSALEAWFDPQKGHLAFAQLTDGTRYNALSGWQSFALAWGGLKPEVAGPATETLNKTTLSTDWGTRLFATDSPYYDALSYNDGSVWPFVTGFAIQAEFRNRRPWAGLQHLRGLTAATGLSGHGFMPEYMSGDRFQALPHSVPHQLFSSSPIVQGVVSGLLGLDGDAMAGTLTWAPQLDWPSDFRFTGYKVGMSSVNGHARRTKGQLELELELSGPPLKVRFEGLLPAGGRATMPLSKEVLLEGKGTALFQWQEGIRAPADADPQIGEASTARRLIRARERGDEVDLEFETPGRPPQRVTQKLR
jgi:hypothetical protein